MMSPYCTRIGRRGTVPGRTVDITEDCYRWPSAVQGFVVVPVIVGLDCKEENFACEIIGSHQP